MKVVRGFLSFVLGVILFALVVCLSASFALKGTIQDDVLPEIIQTEVVPKIEFDGLTESEAETVKEFLKNDSVTHVLNIMIDNYLEYLKNPDSYEVSTADVEKVIDEVKKVNVEVFAALDIDLNDTNIRSKMNEVLTSSFEYLTDSLDEDTVKVIDVYGYITSLTTRLIAIGAIVVVILLTMLVTWSLIKWIRNLGIVTIISGVIYSASYFVVNFFKADILKEIGLEKLDLNTLIIIGAVELVLGILLIVVYKMIKKSKENE